MKKVKTKIRAGDNVVVTTGKCSGQTGRVKAITDHGKRVLVEGVNQVKKHRKPNPQKGIEGGIVREDKPLSISNVAHYNTATGKRDKVGYKFLEDGKKVRYFKSTGEVIIDA